MLKSAFGMTRSSVNNCGKVQREPRPDMQVATPEYVTVVMKLIGGGDVSWNDPDVTKVLLNALSLTHTFLFIGCGVNDPDIRLLLEDSFFKHDATKPHFMVTSDKGIHKEMKPIVENTLNLNIPQYKTSKGSHDVLTNSLNQLVHLVDEHRQGIKETMNW